MLRRLSLLTVIALAGGAGGGCQGSLAEREPAEEKTDFWGRRETDPKKGPVAPSFAPVVLPRQGTKPAQPEDEDSLREKREAAAADQGWQEKVALVRDLVGSGE